MRKLASVQEITNITPIENADAIELATVLGWNCVVKKNEVSIGEKVVYFEIDSFLPIRPEFEFLRSSSYRNSDLMGEGFKLRTMKFRGQVSQGLVLPITVFKEIPSNIEIGSDVTDILGVKKWEIEERASTGGTIMGQLPYDVPKTDEIRVQSMPELINEFANIEYYISTKMDGSSHSLSINPDGFHVMGHNFEYKNDGTSDFYNFILSRDYKERMINYVADYGVKSFVIQGEFCAPGIQKNPLKLTKPEWYVFTIKVDGKRVGLDKMLEICKELDMPTVPIEERGFDLPSKYPTVQSLLERADGNYTIGGGKKEGIVIRPTEPIHSNLVSGPLSMKVVSNKYLLKNND